MAHYFIVAEHRGVDIEQSFEVTRQYGLRVKSIRPFVYVNNASAGNFRFAIYDGVTEIATTATFTRSDVKTAISTSDNYCAVNYWINFTQPVFLKKGTYTLKLISSSYTYSTSDFLGWIIEHENEKNSISYTPVSDAQKSLTFELIRYV